MFYVYVIKSKKDGNLYIGYSNDLRRRLIEHNSGESASTKDRAPFELIYYESYKSKKDAIIRELKLKKFKNSYFQLKRRISNSLES